MATVAVTVIVTFMDTLTVVVMAANKRSGFSDSYGYAHGYCYGYGNAQLQLQLQLQLQSHLQA